MSSISSRNLLQKTAIHMNDLFTSNTIYWCNLIPTIFDIGDVHMRQHHPINILTYHFSCDSDQKNMIHSGCVLYTNWSLTHLAYEDVFDTIHSLPCNTNQRFVIAVKWLSEIQECFHSSLFMALLFNLLLAWPTNIDVDK